MSFGAHPHTNVFHGPCQCTKTVPAFPPAPGVDRGTCRCGGYYAICLRCSNPLYDGYPHGPDGCGPAAEKRATVAPPMGFVDGGGKPRGGTVQWCNLHWAQMIPLIQANTHSGVGASIELMRAWIERRTADGTLPPPSQAAQLNRLMAKDSPICCWLGDEALAACVAKARVRPDKRPVA